MNSSRLSKKHVGRLQIMISAIILIIFFALSGISGGQETAFRLTAGSFAPTEWSVRGLSGDVGYIGSSGYAWPWNLGFGDAWEIGFSCERYISRFGLRVELGMRQHENEAQYSSFEQSWIYKGKLDVYWMEAAFIYRLSTRRSRFSPFLGFGPGIYVAKISQETSDRPYDYLISKRESEIPAAGIRFLTGFDYTLYGGIFFGCELGYSFIQRDFNLEDPDSGSVTRVKDLNIGGTSLRFGVGYQF